MGAYKNWLIGIEELVWEAIEHGFSSEAEVYAYVSSSASVSWETVVHILASIHEYHGEELAA